MSQRSPGERGDAHGEPAEHHAAAKNPPKSPLNPIIHHPIQFASTPAYQIYNRAERFRPEKNSWRRRSLTEVEFRDGVPPPSLVPAHLLASTHAPYPAAYSESHQLRYTATPRSRPALAAPTATRAMSPSTPAPPPTVPKLGSEKMGRMEQVEALPRSSSSWINSASGVVVSAEGLNAQQFNCWIGKGRSGRSYAEVVREGTSTRHPCSAARSEMRVPSPAAHHRRKVRFINNPRVVLFHKDAAPAAIRHLSSLQLQCKPRSCLKQPKDFVSQFIARAAPCKPDAMPLPTEAFPLCIIDSTPASAGKIQAKHIQASWQPVRGRYWRRKKGKTIDSLPVTRHHNSEKFKEKVGDRCFNCLALSHKVAHCREPPKCWKCRGSGHISSGCINKVFSERLRSPKVDDPSGDRRRPRAHHNIHGRSRWRDDEAQDSTHAPKVDCGSNWYRGESLWRRQLRDRSHSPPLSRSNEPRGERRACHLKWRPTEKSTSKTYCVAETMEIPFTHNYVTGNHAGLEHYKYHSGVRTESKSDAILIFPQEHSPTTQQLEEWFGSLARARRTKQPHSDDTTFVWQYMSALDERKATTRCSDAIHIVPSLSFSDEQQRIKTDAVSDNKHDESRFEHDNGQKSEAIVQSIVKTPQFRWLDNQHTKFNESKAPHPENKTDQPMEEIPAVQEIREDNSHTLSGTSVSEPHLEPEEMREDIRLGEHIEVARNVQKHPSTTPTERETDKNFTNILKQFEEAVTTPLEPCLLQTPTTNSIVKEIKRKEQRHSPRLRTKRKIPKKQKLSVRMVHEVLAKWGFPGE